MICNHLKLVWLILKRLCPSRFKINICFYKDVGNGQSSSSRLKGTYLSTALSASTLPFNLSEQQQSHKHQPPNGHNVSNNNSSNNSFSNPVPIRSKSPTSHSPPMSPINHRMANSPKSPRIQNLNKLSNSVNDLFSHYFNIIFKAIQITGFSLIIKIHLINTFIIHILY